MSCFQVIKVQFWRSDGDIWNFLGEKPAFWAKKAKIQFRNNSEEITTENTEYTEYELRKMNHEGRTTRN